MELIRKSDAIRAVLHNTGDAAVAAVQEIEPIMPWQILDEMLYMKIYGYKVRDLIMFAELCERNDVRASDMKQAAWNLELAVRAVMNERQEMIEDEMKKITIGRRRLDEEGIGSM